MAWFCAQCGSPNDPQMPRCRVCGGGAMPGQAGGGYAPQPPGYTQPQAPAGYGAPAAYAPPGGYGAMPQQFPSAAAKRDDSGFKIGCAIAGCLGAFLVIASVLGVILILGASRDEPSPPPDDERPTRRDDDSEERPEPPKSGSLRDNVPQRVGDFSVSSSRPLQVPRAVDAVLVVYRSGSLEMEHAVAVFASEADAETNLVESNKRIVESTKVTGEVVRIKNPQGDFIGTGTHYRANPEVFAYRIGKVMAVIQGPPGQVLPFFQKLP